MTDPLLKIEDLHVSFDTYEGIAEVINGVDLTIYPSKNAALVGETGCGKSVTARTILGLEAENATVEAETFQFKGRDLLAMSDDERHALRGPEMTMIMQDPTSALNPVFTVGEQMLDLLRYQGTQHVGILQWVRTKFNIADLRERALEMLEKVQISAPDRVYDSYPVELSGGMRQRVLIAMTLLSKPDFLIADEPGTALDVTTEERILELMDDLIEETDAAVLYITHDLGVARKVCDQVNVMYAGEVVESTDTDALFERPLHPYTRGLLDSIPSLSGGMGTGIKGQLPDYTDPPPACRFANRCPHATSACREIFPYPREPTQGHAVACHLFSGSPSQRRHRLLASAQEVDIGRPPWEDERNVDQPDDEPSKQTNDD